MNNSTPKRVMLILVVFLSLLKGPMSRGIELANLYSTIQSIAISLVFVFFILFDCWGKAPLKNVASRNTAFLFRYRLLSVVSALLAAADTILKLCCSDANRLQSSNIGLLSAFFLLWLRGNYAQGEQTKWSRKAALLLLGAIAGFFLLGQVLRGFLA